jgi:hypothetical protein
MEAPKSPALPRLRKHIELLDLVINEGYDVEIIDREEGSKDSEGNPVEQCFIDHVAEAQLVEIRDALDWTLTFLENRRDYHRKRQTQQKIEMALLEEKLASAGVDVRKLKSDAVRLAEDAIIDSDD